MQVTRVFTIDQDSAQRLNDEICVQLGYRTSDGPPQFGRWTDAEGVPMRSDFTDSTDLCRDVLMQRRAGLVMTSMCYGQHIVAIHNRVNEGIDSETVEHEAWSNYEMSEGQGIDESQRREGITAAWVLAEALLTFLYEFGGMNGTQH